MSSRDSCRSSSGSKSGSSGGVPGNESPPGPRSDSGSQPSNSSSGLHRATGRDVESGGARRAAAEPIGAWGAAPEPMGARGASARPAAAHSPAEPISGRGTSATVAMAAAFRALRVLLGLFFLLAGAVKLSERLSADAHRQMQEQFVRFAEVFPLRDFGFAPSPGPYLTAVGAVEAAAGLLLAFGPQLLQEISNFVLSVVMIGAIYTLLALREPLAMCAPATLCLGLLLLLNVRGHAAPTKAKAE